MNDTNNNIESAVETKLQPAGLRYEAAAQYTGLSARTLARLVATGELATCAVGRTCVFLRSDLDALLRSRRTTR